MRILVYSSILIFLAVFFTWAYKAMLDIRPKVKRPILNAKAREMIDGLEGRLKVHVSALAEEIGPRNIFLPENFNAASDYIRTFWENTGHRVSTQTFKAQNIACHNLAVEIPGKLEPEKIVLIGAHYDTVSYSPGANDNGSAVAALLELSRLFASRSLRKTMRFVAFANEEPPFFKTRQMGSLVYAKGCKERRENITAMVCLETIGYFREEPKTQKYPFPLSFFYPDKGNFIAVVGNLRSKPLVKSFSRTFMQESDFPVECAATFTIKLPIYLSGLPVLFSPIPGIDWSDHWSFWKCGYPAIMITDTALFRYPYYHSVEDTADKLDYHGLARVTYGIFKALEKMAG